MTKDKKQNSSVDSIKYATYVSLVTGALLITSFAARGGPNGENGGHPFNGIPNLYLDLHIGLILIAVGILIPITSKIRVNRAYSDDVLTVVAKIQLALLMLALVWGIMTYGTLAMVLSWFVLYLEVPLIVGVVLLSLARYNKVLSASYPWYILLAIALNWLSFIFIIFNVTN